MSQLFVAVRVDDVDAVGFAAVARKEPARTEFVDPDDDFDPAVAALDALEYVPAPPMERTADAPNDGIAIVVHNTQTIDSVDIFSSFFISSLLCCF